MRATIVASFCADGLACLAVRVTEADGRNVEYIGRVPMNAAWQAMTAAQRRAALVAAVTSVRDAQIAVPSSAPALSLSGAVEI